MTKELRLHTTVYSSPLSATVTKLALYLYYQLSQKVMYGIKLKQNAVLTLIMESLNLLVYGFHNDNLLNMFLVKTTNKSEQNQILYFKP